MPYSPTSDDELVSPLSDRPRALKYRSTTDSSTGRSQRLDEEEVIVFVEWNYKLSIRRKGELDDRKARAILDVPRWNDTKDIYVTKSDDSGNPFSYYVATVKLNRLGSNLKLKRLRGAVKELYVF